MGERRAEARAPATSAGDAPELVIASIQWPEGRTGVHTHIREFGRYLESEGIPFTLLTPYSWGWPLAVPVFAPRLLLAKVHRAASIGWYYRFHEVFLQRALRRHLGEGRPAVVYAQGPRAARAALRARRGPHQQVVMVVHFLTSQADEWVSKAMLRPESRTFRHIRRIEGETIAGLDGIVYVSEAARDALQAWLPTEPPSRAAVIPNFVAPVEEDGPRRHEADLVTIGSLELPKNHHYLLEVLAEARRMGRLYTLDVFGEGPRHGSLVRQAHDLGLSDQVRFRGFRQDVRTLLSCYTAYVHVSHRESQGIAIIEAMAAGLPLVVGDCGGIQEVCDEVSGARFWPLDDASRAASILIDLLGDDAELASSKSRALAAFRERFGTAAVGPRLYAFLIGGHVPMPGPDGTSGVPVFSMHDTSPGTRPSLAAEAPYR
jgi:glycosyltransferase involved in cell wall biosynthesis